NAKRKPVCTAPPMPRLNGSLRTRTLFAVAAAAVPSVDPSSTTTMSSPGSNARSSSITAGNARSSLRAGTIATRRSSPSPGRASARAGAIAMSDTDALRDAEADRCEQLPRAVRVRVLVEHALARATAELLSLRRIGEQLRVRRHRLVGVTDDAQLLFGVEPPLQTRERIGDDRHAAGGKLEETGRRGGRHVRVHAPGRIDTDARRRDRPGEDVERDLPQHAGPAGVAAVVVTADREVDLLEPAARLADQLSHPHAPELVGVPVEEDVVLLR